MNPRFLPALLILLVSLAHAAPPAPGTSTARFLLIDPSARALGMGALHAAVDRDTFSMAGNPAGLAKLGVIEAASAYTKLFGDTTFNWIGVAMPFRSEQYHMAAGLAGGLFDGGALELDDGTTVKAEQSFFLSGAFATQVFPDEPLFRTVVAGAALKLFSMKLANEYTSSMGWALDFGALYRIPDTRLRFGLSVRNVGSPVKFGSSTDSALPPITALLGAGITILWSPSFSSLLSLEGGSSLDGASLMHAGMEMWLASTMALRVGYQHEAEAGSVNAGVGLRVANVDFDYAAFLHGRLGAVHRASVILRLGGIQRTTGSTRVVKSSGLSWPEWMNGPAFAVTPDGLTARGAGLHFSSTDEALQVAKQIARTALQQTLLAKTSEDLMVISRDWTGPQEPRRQFIQEVNATLSNRVKDLMRSAISRGIFHELTEEVIEPGETDLFVNAYAQVDLPLTEYRDLRKKIIQQYRETVTPSSDPIEAQSFQGNFDRMFQRLDLKSGNTVVLKRQPSVKPDWAHSNEPVSVREQFNQIMWNVHLPQVPSLLDSLSLAEGRILPAVQHTLLARFREEINLAFRRLDTTKKDQVTASEKLEGAFQTAVKRAVKDRSAVDTYSEHLQRMLNGDGAFEESYAVWIQYTVSSLDLYSAAKREALDTVMKSAVSDRLNALEKTILQLQNELK